MDSKTEKQPQKNKEVGERILKLNEAFNFFKTTISSGPKTRMEIARLEGIGMLTGLATTTIAEPIHGEIL